MMLTNAMGLMRENLVNPALTIQLFSHLFHYINMFLFNWLVSIDGTSYCTKEWGLTLQRRLLLIQQWATKQGLEMAAECHLDRICQVLLKHKFNNYITCSSC